MKEIKQSLLLDGYVFKDGRFLIPESDVLDVKQEEGVLADLIDGLKLGNKELMLHHLSLSEEHFLGSKWDDSISNSRKFLEAVMQEVAAAHSTRVKGETLSEATLTRPFAVRDYLETAKLLEPKEKEAIAKLDGLLSHTGGHPYMAESDQARLLRHMALTIAQFVLLRLQGSLAAG